MPTLRKRKDSDQYYVLTSISGQVITFQLSQQGQERLERLLTAAVRDGDRQGHFLRPLQVWRCIHGGGETSGRGTPTARYLDPKKNKRILCRAGIGF